MVFAIKFNLWAIEIGFPFFEKIYPRQSLFGTRYKRNLCRVIVTKILRVKMKSLTTYCFPILTFDAIT